MTPSWPTSWITSVPCLTIWTPLLSCHSFPTRCHHPFVALHYGGAQSKVALWEAEQPQGCWSWQSIVLHPEALHRPSGPCLQFSPAQSGTLLFQGLHHHPGTQETKDCHSEQLQTRGPHLSGDEGVGAAGPEVAHVLHQWPTQPSTVCLSQKPIHGWCSHIGPVLHPPASWLFQHTSSFWTSAAPSIQY